MAQEFKLPALGENIEAGDVVNILVKVGDELKKDQPVLELETDKATVEVPSTMSGTISKILVASGDRVSVGQAVLILEPGAAQPKTESQPAAASTAAKEPAVKAPEPEAPKAATAKEEAPAKEPEPVAPPPVDRPAPKPATAPAPSGPAKLVPASPAIRRFAREIGVDIARVTGTGQRGRISMDDVKRYARESVEKRASGGVSVMASLPDLGRFGTIRREKFSNVRRATAQHLSNAWLNIPHVTNHDEVDITQLEEIRRRYVKKVEEAGGKLTVTAIALKVVASALKVFSKFNASIDMEHEEVVYKEYCNVGVAVDTPRGLLVPVVRDVDRKNIIELSVELRELAERARTGKIAPDDLQGGCFTITNLGGIGGTSFTPIVNFPEVAILGISRSSFKPVYINGKFEPRQILPLSLSYDHRLIDGADAARFLRWVAEALENPFLISLEG